MTCAVARRGHRDITEMSTINTQLTGHGMDADDWTPGPGDDVDPEGWTEWQAAATDLLGVDTSGEIEWVPGAERIIRKGERQTWVANYGGGKTQAAVQFAVQVCAAGGRVVYIDVENDTREMAERLKPVVSQWDAQEAVRGRLIYLPGLNLPAILEDEALMDEFARLMVATDLLVIDSLTRVLAGFGYDEDSNQDVARFMRRLPDALAASGIATLILDNTGHDESRARGAVSKTALIEAAYAVSGGKSVSEAKHGTLKLKRTRSRSGKLADYITAEAGGGDYGPLVAQEGPAPVETDKVAAREKRRAELADEIGDGKQLTAQDVVDRWPVTINTARADLNALVDGGAAEKVGKKDRADVYGRPA
jgi:KaiC/GvpD/RAD55 family RecA-like ATPase